MQKILHSTPARSATLKTILLDRTSFVPYYRQIADQVKEMFQSGAATPGDPFWSEGALATELSVSRMTIRQAFQVLRTEGLLTVTKGKPPKVGAGYLEKNTQEFRGFTEEMKRRGLKPTSKVLSFVRRVPTADIRKVLELKDRDEVFVLRRLRLANGQPVGVETAHLPASLFPGLEHQSVEKQSLYTLLETHFGVILSWSEERIEASAASEDVARLLQIKSGAPLLRVRRVVHDLEDKVVEYGLSLHRGDRYTMTVVSRRNST